MFLWPYKFFSLNRTIIHQIYVYFLPRNIAKTSLLKKLPLFCFCSKRRLATSLYVESRCRYWLVSQSHYRLQYAMVGFYSYQADLACNSFFWKNVCSQVRCGSLAGTPSKELGKFLFHILKLQFNPFSYFHVF